MKHFLKKSLSLVLVVLLAVGIIGTYLPGASAEVKAAEKPKYMAKLVGNTYGGYSNLRISQNVAVEPGATYTLSYDFYVVSKGNIQGWIDDDTSENYVAQGHTFENGTQDTNSVTCSVSSTTTSVEISFQNPGAAAIWYVWNVSFTKEGSTTNLLTNADFSSGNGTWIGWRMYSGYSKTVLTEGDSYDAEVATKREILLYNEDLFSQNIENREFLERTGDEPEYMATIRASFMRPNGATGSGANIGQSIPATAGQTYVLSYWCHKQATGNMQGWLCYSDAEASRTIFQGTDSAIPVGTSKYVSIEYTLKAGEDKINVSFRNPGSTAVCYIWGVSLTLKGADGTNLLRNGNFTEGGGSWIGWKFSNGYGASVNTLATSMTVEKETQHNIISYNPALLSTSNSDIARWSVQPKLEDTLEFTYKTALDIEVSEGTTPEMSFVMTDHAGEIIEEKEVTGTVGDDGIYWFKYEVLPQHLSYTIAATLKVTTAEGEQTQTKTYSAREYCLTLFCNNDTAKDLKNLLVDILYYGAQTQAMFGKADTITTGFTSLISNYGSNSPLANADYISTLLSGNNTGNYKWKSASLVLDGKVTIRLKFFVAEGTVAPTVKVNGEACEIQTGNGYYYVDIPMVATTFDDTVEAKFYGADASETSGATLQYSVNTYLYRKRNSAKEADLLQSIYNYGQSAEAYYNYLVNGTVSTLDNEIVDEWNL